MTSSLAGPWRLLRRRPDLARLLGAALVSLTGDWLLAVGLSYAVYDLTGSTMASAGVFLTALGFGMGNYNDALLQKLADEGDGQYAYIDDDREAERFFLRDLSGVLEVVARDAKAQVEFDPGAVESYRLLGYEKRDVADQDFRNDDVDGGEIGSGHAVTVLYELKLRGTAHRLGTASVRFIDPDSGDAQELSKAIEPSDMHRSFTAAPVGFRRDRALLDQPRQQRLHRRLRPAVDLADTLGQVGRGLRGFVPQRRQHLHFGIACSFRHGGTPPLGVDLQRDYKCSQSAECFMNKMNGTRCSCHHTIDSERRAM